MIYLSRISLNPKSRRVRQETRSPYELHRTLSRAFAQDGDGMPRVLFRLAPQNGRADEVRLYVHSNAEPRWSETTWSESDLRDLPQVKPVDLQFEHNQILRFKLRANPVKRDKQSGNRVALLSEKQQYDWLERKGLRHGFKVTPSSVMIQDEGFQNTGTRKKNNGSPLMTHFSVEYRGLLKVTDPAAFKLAFEQGVGPAKALGFGLLEIAQAT